MSLRQYSVGPLQEGARGFDINQKLTPALCKTFYESGYQFAIRYVRRASYHDFDLSFDETSDILKAGLALMIVQHVASPGWIPGRSLGSLFGQTAAREVLKLKLPAGLMVWCDLEEVADHTTPEEVIAYCNAWYDQVRAAGYTPGLYIGYKPGLGAVSLYKALKFQHYWGAYNINVDEIPITRGLCMKQRAATELDAVHGMALAQFDVNVVLRDLLGNLPLAVSAKVVTP